MDRKFNAKAVINGRGIYKEINGIAYFYKTNNGGISPA